jgi:phosphonate transport system substrate-binding protein
MSKLPAPLKRPLATLQMALTISRAWGRSYISGLMPTTESFRSSNAPLTLQYHSVFITGTHSSIHSLNDLTGKKFAFGDIDSTSAHLMAFRELPQAGINPETDLRSRYSGSHPATAAMVANGTVDAGVIDETVFDFLIKGGQLDASKVRVFYTSKPYLDYVYVARKDVSESVRERFVRALMALRQGKDDSVLRVLRADKFVVADDQEYDATRQMAHELNMF